MSRRAIGLMCLCACLVACKSRIRGDQDPGSPWLNTAADAGTPGTGGAGSNLPAADGSVEFDPTSDPDHCISTRDYFAQVAYPRVFSKCAACHVPGGLAAGTRLVLLPDSVEGYLQHDYDVVDAARALTQGDTPLLLLKPTGMIPHVGQTVIQPGSPEQAVLERIVADMQMPVECAHDVPAQGYDVTAGVTLRDEAATLRKAMLTLIGRVPSDEELASAEADGWDGVDRVLLAAMQERGFHDRLLEIWNDVFLTDQLLEANGGGVFTTYDTSMFPHLEDAGPVWLAPGERLADSFAREPLELVAHVIMSDRPLTEIVTAQYRMANPLTAHALSLDLQFDDANNPDEWRQTQIPAIHDYAPGKSEYAGVLTTNASLKVITGASTNRNRRRARYTYKWMLDFDIMKTATRIDFSTVDFTSNPWLNNALCTGCHAKIDPVAGLFQNWTNCYDSGVIRYFKPNERYCGNSSWWPEGTMFQPGLREGETLDQALIPEALEQLSASIVADPAFARAMVKHVFAGVIGRPVQEAPQNTADPNFSALQAAYDAEHATIEDLATWFGMHGFDTKALILRILRSPYFRAIDADAQDRPELAGMGSSGLVNPESMQRRLLALLGQGWGEPGSALLDDAPSRSPYYLLNFRAMRLHAGGIDSKTPGQRLERPSGLTSAVFSRMAYEMACRSVPLDFSLPKAQRRLFAQIDASTVPNPQNEPALRATLQSLHQLLLGEPLATDSEELDASYALLVALYEQTQSEGTSLGPCRADVDYATSASVSGGLTSDPSHTIRAWQGVIAYLLMDADFMFD